MARQTNFRRRGAGYIEVLVSTIILVLCLLAAISLFGFSMKLVDKTGDEGMAYNIARKALESVRQQGFDPINPSTNAHTLPDGTTTSYFDSMGTNETSTKNSNSRFKLVRVIKSVKPDDPTKPDNVIGTSLPAPDAVRHVTVTVYYASSGEQIEQTGTILVRSGV